MKPLRAAGAPDDKAAAAKVLANIDDRFNRVHSDLGAIRVGLAPVKWIVRGFGFGVLLLVLRSFWPGA